MIPMLKHYPSNTVGRDFVIGDLHGCLDQFNELLSTVGFDPAVDRVFSVGDLIDRGPQSAECMRLVEKPWFHAVQGNHERLMVDARASFRNGDEMAAAIWVSNGGEWAFGHIEAEMRDLEAMAEALPLVMIVGEGDNRFGVLHAEFLGDVDALLSGDYSMQDTAVIQWGRSLIKGQREPKEMPFPIYVGHTIVRAHTEIGSFRFIDTGSYRARSGEGAVSMVEPATGKVWISGQPDPVSKPTLEFEDA